jgi:glycosyltransferase involved in cell wall biosynthesis
VGGDAVEYADPTDVGSICEALERVLGSPQRRAELSEASRRRAAQFSWARTAEIILGVLSAVARPQAVR